MLVFDEPLSNLDPRSSSELMRLINGLNDAGKDYCNFDPRCKCCLRMGRIISTSFMRGRVIGQGTPQDVFTNAELLCKASLEKPWILEAYDRIIHNEIFINANHEIPKDKTAFI